MADEPVPITATRLPVKSTPSSGQRPVCQLGPLKVSAPGSSASSLGIERQPVAMTHVAGGDRLAAVGGDVPAARGLVEDGGGDAGLELDVAAQVEAVGDVVEVAEQLRLGGVALGPVPLRSSSGEKE